MIMAKGFGSGAGRLQEEARRVQDVLERAAVPDDVGPVPLAPARTTGFVVGMQRAIVGGTAVRAGHWEPREPAPRRTLTVADVFDAMEEAARRRHRADRLSYATAKGEVIEQPFVPPFTPGQISVARHYRALVEKRGGAGIKCASMEGRRGASGGGSFMDTFIQDGLELEGIRKRIGDGFAMEVRRVRPSKRGGAGARTIRCRDLVDMVCLGDHSLSQVLRAHGWAEKRDHRDALRVALAAILSRM
ncbi:hypothetical protein V8J36_05365 [Frigidibacter sp. MR17.14]|uniref:hypothetical protein n=1 Tax=Frigidibacter sp. MR17.14 TaxID=3126509 RepID=UPI003012DF93